MITMKRVRKEYRAYLRNMAVGLPVKSLRQWASGNAVLFLLGDGFSPKAAKLVR